MRRAAPRFALCLLFFATAVSLHAAVFTSSQNGNWSSSSTWGGAGVPAPGDTAIVNHTVTLDVPVSVGTLTLTNTLTGSQSLTVTSAFNWNGGTLSGSGSTSFPSGCTVTLAGYGTVDQRSVTLGGTLNTTSGYYFYLQNNATLTNNGIIDFQGDGGIYINGAVGSCVINNNGTIKKSAGTGTGGINVPISATSGAQLLQQSGTLTLSKVTSAGATFDAGSGSTINFNTNDTRTFDAASTISGAGTVVWQQGTNTVSGTYNVTGTTTSNGAVTTIASPTSTGALNIFSGTLTLNGASTLTVPTLTMNNGTLNGTMPITFSSSPMTWSGGTIGGSGLLTIPSGTTVNIASVVLDARPLSNGGTINLTSSYWYVGNNAVVSNSGAINFTSDGSIVLNGALGTTSLVNSGSIVKSGGSSGSTISIPMTLQGGSTLDVQSNILYVSAIAATNAAITISSGANLYLYYNDTRTFDATTTISGAGTLQSANGVNTVNGPYSVTGTTLSTGGTLTLNSITSTGNVTCSGGTLTLNSGSAISVPALTMSGGTLAGTAPISVTNSAMSWTNGTISGSGLLTIPGGTTVTLTSLTLDGRAITNNGTINMVSNGSWYVGNNAVVTNNGTIDLQGDSNIYQNGPVGTTMLNNNGTLKKSAGSSGSSINVAQTMSSGSQLQVMSGPFYVGLVTATGTNVSVTTGATLYFYYGGNSSFDAASSFSGTGTVQFGNGTNTINASYNMNSGATIHSGGATTLSQITNTGNVTCSGGTLTLNSGSALTIPTLTMSGGILTGTAPINVTAASMSWNNGTLSGSGAIAIPISTTISINSGLYITGTPVTNNGIINIVSNGSLNIGGNATFINNGTLDIQADGQVYQYGAVGTTSLTNNGTIKKSGGTSGSNFTVPLIATSGSQFLAQSGPIYLGPVTATGATFYAYNSANLYFYYGDTRTFDAASTVGSTAAATIQWGNGTNTVNGSYDANGPTIHNGGTTTIGNITSFGSLNVTGGTLTLNSGSAINVSFLTISGGTLNGTAPINLTGSVMSWSGGTIGGSGLLTIPNSTTITLSFLNVDGRPVTNNGTVNMVSNGYMYLFNNAVFTNNLTFDLQGDSNIYISGAAGTTSFTNNATLKKSAGTGSGSTISVPLILNSGSQLLQQSGTMYVGPVTSTNATVSLSGGTNFIFYYGTASSFDASSTISGAGTTSFQGGTTTITGTISTPIAVIGGTATINSASPQSVPSFGITGGTLNGSSTINIGGGSMNWTGGTISGSGAINISNLTTITMTGGMTWDARTFTNNGTLNVSGSSYAYLQNNGLFTNNGLIDFLSDGNLYLNGAAGTTSIVNNGTIRKSGGANSYVTVPLTAASGSQVLVQAGTLYLGATTATSATFSVAAGTTLYGYTSDARTFDAATTISGAGTYQQQGGSSTISGTISTNLVASGGTLTINTAAPQSVPTLVMAGGTLNGSTNVTITGASMTWTGGTVSGSGTLVIPNGTAVTLSGVVTFDARPVTLAGTFQISTTYYAYLQNNAVLTNSGLIDILADGHIYLNGAAGSTAIVNSGTIRKSSGTTSYFTVPLTAQSGSQFLVQSGVVYLGAVTATSSTFSISSGSSIYTYTADNRTFDAATSIAGAGVFQQQGGSSTVSGTISSNVTVGGGTLTINSAATQSIPTLAMSGGTLSGSANVNITGATMTWTGGTIGGTGTLTIPNGTTINITGYPYFDARPVTNAGTINFTTNNYGYVQNNAVITNSGLIDFLGDGSLYLNGAAGTTAVVSSGTIRKSAGTNSYFTVPLTMNGGQLNTLAGTIYLGALTSTGGTLNIASGATLYTYTSDPRTLDGASSIIGSGTFQQAGGSTTTAGTISTNVLMSGGTLTINSASAQSIPVLTMSNGTLNGSAAINVTGTSMTWSGGTISGSGAFTIPAATTVTFSGYVIFDTRTFTNNGTMRWTAAVYLYMQNNASLVNNGTLDLQNDAWFALNTGSASITNNGTLKKTGGTATSNAAIPFTNAAGGTIQASSGLLGFTNTFTNSGTLYFPIAGAASFGKVNIPGNFPLSGTLTATTTGGYTPVNGTTFQILTYGSYSGSFPNKNLDYSGGTFVESYSPTSLIISAGPQLLAITNVSPNRGTNAGGTTVSITGSNFFATTSVTFGGVPAASVTYNNSTSLTAVTPAGTTGPVDVVVTNPSTQTATLTSGYTYTGLLARYSFDVAGTPGKDVANNNDATSVTGVTQVSGKIGQAASFSSGSMTLPATNAFDLRAGGDFTLDAWVNSSSGTNGDWFMKGSGSPLYGLGTYNTAQAIFSFDNGSSGSVTSLSNLFDGNWHHVAAVHRGANAEMWVDGKLESTQSVSGSSDGGFFTIGGAYAGLIDEAKLYNYALSTAEIRTDALAPDLAIAKSATPTVTVGQNITYTITVANNGPVAATNVTVADALPLGTAFVSATPSQGSCSGNPNISCALGGISSGNSATITILAAATSAGTITNTANVTATEVDPVPANNSSSASTTASTLSCATPTITAGGPTTFCAGGNVTLTANAAGATSYQWYLNGNPIGAATGTSYTATASGNYSVTVTYPSACSASSAATTVTVNPLPPAPSITASGPTTFCNGGSVTLDAPAGYTYLWSNGATTQSINVTTSGNYSVTVFDANGCGATSAPTTVNVTNITAPTVTPSGPTTFCAGGNVTLTASAGYASYSWSNGATSQAITVNTSGTYTVTVTDVNGCVATSTPTNVSVTPAPAVTITGPGFTCASTPVTLDAGAGYTSYSWSTGATTQTITVTPPAGGATYSVTVSNGSGCNGTASHFVAVGNSVTPVIGGPSAACPNVPITLDAGAGFSSYLWSTGATTQTITVTQNATTTYSVTVGSGSCSGSASKTVTMNTPPTVTITGPSNVCPNTSFTLDAGPGFASYAWSNGATTQTITVPQTPVTQTYTVTVTDAAGCTASDSHTVTLGSGASAVITAPASAQANATGLTASVAAGPAGTTYSWSITNGTIMSGQATPSIAFSIGSTTATINVTVTTGSCTATGTKSVQITNSADLSLLISASPDPATAGSTLTYLIAVTNHGPSAASNVVVTDTLPAGVTFVSASGPGWSCTGATAVQCSMPSLAVGPGSISIAVKAPNSAGTITNGASIDSATADSKPANNSFSLTTLVNAPPSCPSAPPSLVAPANGATGVISPVSLQWNGIAGASSYDVFTSVDGAAATLAGSTSGTSLFVNLPSGSITWFVVAHVPNCSDLTSGTLQFTISPAANCNAHSAPVLLAPVANASVTSPVNFSWQPVAEAVGYRVWMSVDGGADEDIGTTNGATTLTHTVNAGNVTWVVDALFNGCPSVRSDRGSFVIPKGDACAGHTAPTLLAPANNSTSQSSSIDFQWTAVDGASGYRVWVAIDGTAPAVVGETGGTSLHAVISNGSVDWFIEALFDGCPSVASSHFLFTVPKAQNCGDEKAALVSPANNSTTSNASVQFSWNGVPGATGYELYLSLDNGSPVLIGTTDGATTLTKEVSAGTLKWFVRALFDGCPARDSQTFTFVYAPPANCKANQRPLLASPIDGSTVLSPVSFEWSNVGASSYKLFVNAQQLNSSTAQQLTPGVYEWYVEANFNGCATLRSTTSTFTVVPKPQGCPVPERPTLLAPSEVSAGVAYKVRWLPALGSDAYVVQEANNAAFANAITLPQTNDNKLTFSHNEPGTFFYRVRGVSNCTTEAGPYSTVVGVSILPQNANDGAASPDAPVTLKYSIPLDAALAGQNFTATPTEPWLTVTPPSGTIPAGGMTLTVTANTAGLPLGTSLGGVTITTSAPSSSRYASNGSSSSTTTLTVNVVQPVSPTSKNTPPPDALIIPAVAHADGFNSHFQSDVRLTNTSPQPMKYQLTFTPSGEEGLANGKQATVNVEPGSTIALDDVLKSWFSSGSSDGATGTLEIRPLTTTQSKVTSNAISGLANLVTFASSRTFNNTGSGTYGQYIPAIPFANFIGKGAGSITLQQIAQSVNYRTNLGIVEGSGQPASILVSIFGSNGQKIKDFPVDLKGGQHLQLNSFLTTQGLSLEDARVEVKVATGSGKVTAYASVLDNRTADPLLVTPMVVTGSGSTKYVLPGVADLNAWHSDVRIYNASSTKTDAQLMFVSQNGTTQTQSITLQPNEIKELDNLLQSTFGVTNEGGALHISTANPANLVATARTYNASSNGTYGQFISAVTPNDAAAVGTRPLQLLQIEESDRYRTNVGLAEVSGKPAKVEVTVVPPDSKVSATVDLDLGANEFRQLNQVLKSVGMENTYNARVTVQVIGGDGKVTAYASVIDMVTQDPTLLQAQ